jgi:hypothetical protein
MSSRDISEELKLALSYAEESTKRTRWIVFIMQLGVILVMASVWQQSDLNWLSLRLTASQRAVRYLECEPENAYASGRYPETMLRTAPKLHESTQITPEVLDDLYSCIANPLNEVERKQARTFISDWGYSLSQAKQHVNILQQAVNAREMGISVPVLGITFDVNDLSVIAGLTFSVLLSWFFFSLKRQHKNIRRIFIIGRESKNGETSDLCKAYHLLAMSQVITIPPGRTTDSRNVPLLRRLSRLPNLIMWTAATAQLIVVIDDFETMEGGDYLSPLVNRAETALAIYLLIYILYRTVKCFQLIGNIDDEWLQAYSEINPQKNIEQKKFSKLPKWIGIHKLPLMLSLLLVATATHILDELRPHLLTTLLSFSSFFYQAWVSHLSMVAHMGAWILSFVLPAAVMALIWNYYCKRKKITFHLATIVAVLATLDVAIHTIIAFHEGQVANYKHFMEGFYSSPFVLFASLFLLFLMAKEKHSGANADLTNSSQITAQICEPRESASQRQR